MDIPKKEKKINLFVPQKYDSSRIDISYSCLASLSFCMLFKANVKGPNGKSNMTNGSGDALLDTRVNLTQPNSFSATSFVGHTGQLDPTQFLLCHRLRLASCALAPIISFFVDRLPNSFLYKRKMPNFFPFSTGHEHSSAIPR